jgi:hypothetical protein
MMGLYVLRSGIVPQASQMRNRRAISSAVTRIASIPRRNLCYDDPALAGRSHAPATCGDGAEIRTDASGRAAWQRSRSGKSAHAANDRPF